jgi:3D (Asp-Asp-Asp) domain-containing protein
VKRAALVAALLLAGTRCSTMGSQWVAEPAPNKAEGTASPELEPPQASTARPAKHAPARSIGGDEASETFVESAAELRPRAGEQRSSHEVGPELPASVPGRRLGTFRNTYYNFPRENDYEGRNVSLFDARCRALAQVPEPFHDAVCMQGSGLLADGRAVSFARRDCHCARRCPRSGQHICFEALDQSDYPWGRGATGRAIVPLLTVAVDSRVIPLGTPLYIPEYEGLPRDAAHSSEHDGCFVAQDRGFKVRGEHVDIFTGDTSITELWNRLVPSNTGVTVIVDNPACAGPVPRPVKQRRRTASDL